MPRPVLRPALLVAALAFLAACGGTSATTAPQVRNLTGIWSGTTTGGFTFAFTIIDSAQTLHGNGSASVGSSTPIGITIVGSHDHPFFHISFTFSGTFQPVSFDGSDSTATELVGVLTGSGFTGEQLVEVKQ